MAMHLLVTFHLFQHAPLAIDVAFPQSFVYFKTQVYILFCDLHSLSKNQISNTSIFIKYYLCKIEMLLYPNVVYSTVSL